MDGTDECLQQGTFSRPSHTDLRSDRLMQVLPGLVSSRQRPTKTLNASATIDYDKFGLSNSSRFRYVMPPYSMRRHVSGRGLASQWRVIGHDLTELESGPLAVAVHSWALTRLQQTLPDFTTQLGRKKQ